MTLALVILAAGESRRLGTCKALVDLGGSTPLERLVAAGARVSDAAPLVVTGAHHDAIAERLPRGVEVVRNERWSDGRVGGVALAAAARADHDLVIAPVDVPLVPHDVFAALADEWRARGSPARGWLAPFVAVAGTPRFGHPVVVGRALLRELDCSRKDFPSLRDLRSASSPRLELRQESARILDDLDTPDDLVRLRALLS